MKLRRYAVTVMDNWTPMRTFWTRRRATRWRDRFHGHAYLYIWINDGWRGPMW
jgi:hypothetical protein